MEGTIVLVGVEDGVGVTVLVALGRGVNVGPKVGVRVWVLVVVWVGEGVRTILVGKGVMASAGPFSRLAR